MLNQPPVTAIVIFRNEAPLLKRCLSALAWCDEIVGVDMDSTDDSAEVAARFVDRMYRVDPYPIAEPTRVAAARLASHDWVLLVDPDEVIPDALARRIQDVLTTLCPPIPSLADSGSGNEASIPGAVALPMKFYFKGDRLDGTVWGTLTHKLRLVHRDRCDLLPLCNRISELRPGFTELRLKGESRGDDHIRHYWSDSYWELAKRHFTRYAHLEAKALVARGRRFGWHLAVGFPLVELRRTLRDFDGWRLGLRGWILSTIYFLYVVASSWLTLYYQRSPRIDTGEHAAAETLPILEPHILRTHRPAAIRRLAA